METGFNLKVDNLTRNTLNLYKLLYIDELGIRFYIQ